MTETTPGALRAADPADVPVLAAVLLAEAGDVFEALAWRAGCDTVTCLQAAADASEAYTTLLPHTPVDLPDPPPPGDAPADLRPLADLLAEAADALDRAARQAEDPDRIHDLAHAANLAAGAGRALALAGAVR